MTTDGKEHFDVIDNGKNNENTGAGEEKNSSQQGGEGKLSNYTQQKPTCSSYGYRFKCLCENEKRQTLFYGLKKKAEFFKST